VQKNTVDTPDILEIVVIPVTADIPETLAVEHKVASPRINNGGL